MPERTCIRCGAGNPNRIDMLFAALSRTDNPAIVLGIVGCCVDAYVGLSEGDYLHQALENHSDHVRVDPAAVVARRRSERDGQSVSDAAAALRPGTQGIRP